MRVKLTVAYLGTPFLGWQRQAEGRTVQGAVEGALTGLVGEPVVITGAGRTDAGVHAAGQVAHADLPVDIPPQGLVRALNGRLPEEIRMRRAERVADDFDARRDAVAKRYVYRALWRAPEVPWRGQRSAVVPPPSRWKALRAAARLLEGRRDVASFTVPDHGKAGTVRTLYSLEVKGVPGGARFELVGDGFLRYQVRRMVGALLEVGRSERTVNGLRRLLREARPGAAIRTAPARGLTLERVYYGGDPVIDFGAQEVRDVGS